MPLKCGYHHFKLELLKNQEDQHGGPYRFSIGLLRAHSVILISTGKNLAHLTINAQTQCQKCFACFFASKYIFFFVFFFFSYEECRQFSKQFQHKVREENVSTSKFQEIIGIKVDRLHHNFDLVTSEQKQTIISSTGFIQNL